MKQLRANLISKPVAALAVAALSFLIGAQAVFSQGTVVFANTGIFHTDADRRVYDPITCAPLVGANWVATLYFGTDSGTIDTLAVKGLDDLTLASAIARFRDVDPSHSSAGTWIGGTRFLPGASTLGQSLTMQVRVWDLSQFATFDEARTMGGYAMESAPFDYVINPSSDPASHKINNFQGITPPECVPEPSVFALWAVGVGVLLAWRCKEPEVTGSVC